MPGRRPLATVVGLAVAAGLLLAPQSSAHPSSVPQAAVSPAAVSQEAPVVDVGAVLPHLEAFQRIAEGSDGNRAAGTAGYAGSVDYVAGQLSEAGYTVQRQRCGADCTDPDDESVVADWPGGDASRTVLIGAHLDSVTEGAGSDDNASGSAAALQAALTLAETKPAMLKHVRFGWWADEEETFGGSYRYVAESGTDDLETYLNLDMVGSPNPGYFLTNLDSPQAKAVAGYLDSVGRSPEEVSVDCDCSDDLPFREEGVPTTYLSTASNDAETMSEEQARKWGGQAGESFDACYHSACDTYPANINTEAMGHTTNAVVHAVWELAVQPDGR